VYLAVGRPPGEPGEDPDLELVRRVGAGDQRACAALVDRHLPKVLGLASRLLGNRADAEEVAQEVFLRVWRHAGEWRPGGAKFSTWLHRVTFNLCHDRLRRRRETTLDAIGDPPSGEPPPGTELQRAAVTARVEAALAQLPYRQREAILLCHYQELGNIEAAEAMEISVSALESLLARGRRRLKELLAGELSDLMGELR
jgi:RNA polymerase sigma-70 factor (ECF subfamily)